LVAGRVAVPLAARCARLRVPEAQRRNNASPGPQDQHVSVWQYVQFVMERRGVDRHGAGRSARRVDALIDWIEEQTSVIVAAQNAWRK
jgi:hypothetical protein